MLCIIVVTVEDMESYTEMTVPVVVCQCNFLVNSCHFCSKYFTNKPTVIVVSATAAATVEDVVDVMPATHAQETCTRNVFKSSDTRNLYACQSGTSFLHTVEHSSIPAQKLSGA